MAQFDVDNLIFLGRAESGSDASVAKPRGGDCNLQP
jgi:hypothetical protein